MMFGGDHKLGSFIFANENERSFERAADRAVNEQVRQIFDNARHFDSAYPVVGRLAKQRGWIFIYQNGWHTKSTALETRGTHGPRFDTFGELLTWLLEQPEMES